MPALTRNGDGGTGHGDFPPRHSTSGSSDVFCNGKAVHRVGDHWAQHCNSTPTCHQGALASGSRRVFANGLPVGRIGDPVDCGSLVAAGSHNVFAGG
ncbi:PAAR domain-containing protein [Celerinatantimonas sp. YJH-8]|uniref:PAAR domain-containing protein n=1 Tax=Celerinatantimonas sp. YJH-8 TaxID=3228714 RepID=UPI0038C69A8C